jgi:hypothetical protein
MSTLPVTDVIPFCRLDALHLWDRNRRHITDAAFAQLKRSMQADPAMMYARPCIALPDGRVFAGNMRLRAAQELEWPTVPTVYADIDENRTATWALRDNNPYGVWDELALAELLHELEGAARPHLTGFARDDLDRLLASIAANDEPDERGTDLALADVSIGDPTHKCEHGDVWNLGEHTLIVVGVYDEWQTWCTHLGGDDLFVPYPTPTLPLTVRATNNRLVMVQPDPWLAGHVLDKYAAVRGADTVRKQ